MQVTIEKSTESTRGGYINKLIAKADDLDLGNGITVPGAKQTFYLKTNEELAEEKVITLPMDKLDVVLRDFTFTNDEEEEETVQLKWLHAKRA
jgi:hypothetical protein